MSGESALHVRLVEHLVGVIEARHHQRNLIVLADHHRFGSDRPETIGRFLPDVFARDLPETFRIIGEAKTPKDLESPRSRLQVAAFLDHLSVFPCPSFHLAVPWMAVPRANAIIKSVLSPGHASVKIEVLRHG